MNNQVRLKQSNSVTKIKCLAFVNLVTPKLELGMSFRSTNRDQAAFLLCVSAIMSVLTDGIDLRGSAGNAKGESITVLLTSCLTGLD